MTKRKPIQILGVGEPETWTAHGVQWVCPEVIMADTKRTIMLVIDSHPERHAKVRRARTEGMGTAHAISLESVARHADRMEPDAVLLAYDEQTEDAIRILRDRYPDVPILLWLEPEDAVAGLALVRRHHLRGAVSREMEPEEIEDEVRRAMGRPTMSVTREIRARMETLAARLEAKKRK